MTQITGHQSTERRSAPRAKRTLIGAIRSETKRLNRPTFAGVGAGLMAFFALFGTLIVFMFGDGLQDAAMPPGMGIPIVLESARGVVAGLSMSADLVGIVALSLWAASAASDYTTGWIRLMVQAEPRRWRLLAGKGMALAAYTVGGTLIATVVCVSVAPMLASATGVATELWSPDIVGTVWSGWLNLTISVLIWGIIGFTIATVTRSAVVAIAGGIGYLMVFEGVLGLAAEGATTYLPGSILGTVVAGGTDDLAYGSAVLLAVVIAAAAMGVSTSIFHRRDITS